MRWLIAIYGPVVALVWIGAGVVNALLVLGAIVFLVLVLRVDIMSEWIEGQADRSARRRFNASSSTSSK
jgi:hypothetical protein